MWDDSASGEGECAASSGGGAVRSATRRKRTSFSKEHVDLLRSTFENNPYPGISLRETLSQRTGIPESRIQVWFQNRRARTLKGGGGAKKALWQGDSTAPESFPAPHPVSSRGPQVSPSPEGPAGVPPTCQAQMRNMDGACFYDQSPPPAYSTSDDQGHAATYDCTQGRLHGGVASTPLRGYWPQPGGSTHSPITPVWCRSDLDRRNSGAASSRQPTLRHGLGYHTPSMLPSANPETPDSGFEEKSLENSPGKDIMSTIEDLWGEMAVEDWGDAGYAPLPELPLGDILEELNEEWLGGGQTTPFS